MTIHQTLRTRLREYIDRDPRTLAEIYRHAGYSETHTRRVLTGEKPNPTIAFVAAFAGALGVEPTDLLR